MSALRMQAKPTRWKGDHEPQYARIEGQSRRAGEREVGTHAEDEFLHPIPDELSLQTFGKLSALKMAQVVRSFIHRLPNELLCSMFLLCGDPSPVSCFPRDPVAYSHSFLSSRVHLYSESVVLIGRVCSRWRGVTHGCPALWTLVDVGYPGKQALAILRRCLAYSAGLPLVLRISKSITPNLNASSIDSRFMSLVAAHARRWAEISIDLSGSHDVLQPLIDLPPGSFHLLQRAHVSFYRLDRAAVSPDALLWDAILTSPRMQSAELLKVQYTLSGLASAPLPRFTRLGLHSAEPEMVAHVIEACPMLDTLYVSIFPPVMGDARPLPIHRPVDLQHLRVLMLCGNTDWNPLLENLILPNLDRLDMSRMSVHRNAVEQMLERSAARPRMLAIHWPTVGQARDIVALLVTSALQNLKVLRYKRCCLDLGWEGDLELKPFVPAGISYTTDSGEAEMAYESLQHKPR